MPGIVSRLSASRWSAATRLATIGIIIIAASIALTTGLIVWEVEVTMN